MRHLTAALLATAFVVSAAARAQPAAPSPAKIFAFAQPFWVNLHHFLYVLGRADNRAPDRARRAVAGAPKDQAAGLATLSADDQAAWRAAVTAYARTWSKKDTVFDADLSTLTRKLVVDDAGIDDATADVLQRAAPIYRKAWWPAHTQANTARIDALETLVARYGAQVLAFMERAYQEPWPADGYPVNISAYSNWAGAYSTDGRLLVVSSLDPGTDGLSGLEILFHEATHQWDEAMQAKLAAAGARAQKTVPAGLSHAMIFYAAGQAVRSVVPDYTPYADANGVWARGMTELKPALDAAWAPYLNAKPLPSGSGADAAASKRAEAARLDAALDEIIRRLQ